MTFIKKLWLVNIVLCFCLFFFNQPIKGVNAEETSSLDLNTSYYVLMEPNSKQVITQSNPHLKLYPASMPKMMGMLLNLEGNEDKKISFDDIVTCSEYASSMGGTQIYLESGEKMILSDLFKAVAINSANDAIVCLGEYLAGSIDNFVKMMNNRAKELKMNNTSLKNATGFDDQEHYSSPYDMAILASELLKYQDVVLKYSSMKEAYIREDTSSPFWLVNTNKLLGHYEGLDGLKTGYTSQAGYNLTSTCQRNGVRLVAVVMHENTIQERSQDTIKLLDYGFQLLKAELLFNKDEIISKCNFNNTIQKNVEISIREDVFVVYEKKYSIKDLNIEVVINKLDAPILKDEKVGILKILTPCGKEFYYPLYANQDVEQISFIEVWLNNLKLIFK